MYQNAGTYNVGVFSTAKASAPAAPGSMAGVPVMDEAGIASGGAFLVSELEKRDTLIRKPLTSYTYPRDIVVKVGGGWVDFTSAMSVAYGITGGSGDSPITAGGANGVPVVQASMDKGVYKAHVFAAALRVMFVDMQKVRINDPASTKDKRLNGDPGTFQREVKNYWLVDARAINKEETMSYDKFKEYMDRYRAELGAQKPASWAVPYIERCIDAGIMANVGTGQEPEIDRPGDFLTRQEAALLQALTLKAVK